MKKSRDSFIVPCHPEFCGAVIARNPASDLAPLS